MPSSFKKIISDQLILCEQIFKKKKKKKKKTFNNNFFGDFRGCIFQLYSQKSYSNVMLENFFFVTITFTYSTSLLGSQDYRKIPSLGVFLRDPSPYLREFRRKLRKTPNA